jgi:hypothetical protein
VVDAGDDGLRLCVNKNMNTVNTPSMLVGNSIAAYCLSFHSRIPITELPDVGGNIIISRSIPNSLINLILRSTSSLKLVSLGLSARQRLLSRLNLTVSNLSSD